MTRSNKLFVVALTILVVVCLELDAGAQRSPTARLSVVVEQLPRSGVGGCGRFVVGGVAIVREVDGQHREIAAAFLCTPMPPSEMHGRPRPPGYPGVWWGDQLTLSVTRERPLISIEEEFGVRLIDDRAVRGPVVLVEDVEVRTVPD